ncbi:hypothetical protein PC9H_001201 [Pleurotus ostreatus]|uniref:Uncharacterized protein n=2 Tax=Pleurotus ostreatus TaxID=5322 RepID=A0A067P0E2_PLEO1|nr:uncharacterized protein PC9H_001201 [Pleurotus ostreatus]KAF7440853.1 hypothetical protein PC9H_001201 [Pleurotus ostreatus]KDQ33649.1 hypothetical protein PLEOSDRAFT_164294 [Pleurotus ostreatus PC15]
MIHDIPEPIATLTHLLPNDTHKSKHLDIHSTGNLTQEVCQEPPPSRHIEALPPWAALISQPFAKRHRSILAAGETVTPQNIDAVTYEGRINVSEAAYSSATP